jgi:hypothetical protein
MSISDDFNVLADFDVEPGAAEVFEEAPPTNAASTTSRKFEDRCARPKAREEDVHGFVRCLETAFKEGEPWIPSVVVRNQTLNSRGTSPSRMM